MKKIKIVLLIALICIVFTGCNSLSFSSIDDLIAPVAPSGDNAGVKAAVDNYCKSGYSIKIPPRGKYSTSFIIHDLDGDGDDEAIAFYEPADKLGVVNMALVRKVKSQWEVVNNIVGDGADVSSVDFSDVNNDGREEIIVCWSMLSKSSTSNLCVYSVSDDYKLDSIADSITAGDFICVDINDDSVEEVLVFIYGSSTESPKAKLYSFDGDYKHLIGETKLDSTIISFSHIVCGRSDEGMSVYADAVRSNGNSMVTELLYWSDYYDSVVSPFYSYSTGKTSATLRNNTIFCRDIDDDDEIEIPTDKSVSGLPKQITAQNWVSFNNTVLNHKAYSIACKKDGYIIKTDDKLFSKMKLSYDTDKRELTIKSGKTELFRIMTVIKSGYDSNDYSGYTEIFSDSGYIYLASINEKSNITIDELKDSIKPY